MRAVVVPSTLALLPAYAGLVDPVATLRDACLDAVRWLVAENPSGVRVVSAPARADNIARGVPDSAGERIARHLLGEVGFIGAVGVGEAVLVVANGSARRTEKSPGHFDERAADFDTVIGDALRSGHVAALAGLDDGLAEQLWCHDVPAVRELAAWADGPVSATLDHESDEHGVAYWVARWSCGS